MSFPNQDRRDDIVYFLLNKVKHTEEKAEDVSYFPQNFDDKIVNKDEVQQHLQYVIDSGYLKGHPASESAAGAEDAPLAVCKNAQITPEGTKLLRVKYFMV
ncbi:MAG: hypothetical protein F6K04_07255 [Leptolyngbya sp. SIO4C5]|nr:hypothetical protein [Leptolyngbya sp. SIO4C5]